MAAWNAFAASSPALPSCLSLLKGTENRVGASPFKAVDQVWDLPSDRLFGSVGGFKLLSVPAQSFNYATADEEIVSILSQGTTDTLIVTRTRRGFAAYSLDLGLPGAPIFKKIQERELREKLDRESVASPLVDLYRVGDTIYFLANFHLYTMDTGSFFKGQWTPRTFEVPSVFIDIEFRDRGVGLFDYQGMIFVIQRVNLNGASAQYYFDPKVGGWGRKTYPIPDYGYYMGLLNSNRLTASSQERALTTVLYSDKTKLFVWSQAAYVRDMNWPGMPTQWNQQGPESIAAIYDSGVQFFSGGTAICIFPQTATPFLVNSAKAGSQAKWTYEYLDVNGYWMRHQFTRP
jgi:hypothetical protein